jgi:hypothetical protein
MLRSRHRLPRGPGLPNVLPCRLSLFCRCH